MSAARRLLFDIGNSRLKWGFARAGVLSRTGAQEHGGTPAAALYRVPELEVDEVWIAHVTGAVHEAALSAAVSERYGVAPSYARSTASWQGLRNAYREPERLGIDRWLAMIAGWAQQASALCVVDAGTALTADCVDAGGNHLGGFIAGGVRTQQAAVLGTTRFAARMDEIDEEARLGAGLGRHTEACVRQGAMLACLGAIDRAAVIAGPGARLLISGGDAPLLLPHLQGNWEYRPHLVLEGVLALAGS